MQVASQQPSAAIRGLFFAAVAAGASTIWLAPHPPMIDLPQHAGQLALLKQMLIGDTRWSALFQINFFTPYLIGFGLTLPLTFVMPIAAALKVMLTLAYLAFVFMCVTLRRHLGADARVDWLFLCPFFGYAFHWGFFTFLTASPLGLLLVLLSDRYALAPSMRRGLHVAALGLLLLVSHGLVFLFALAVSAALLLARAGSLRRALRLAWPLLIVALACGAYALASRSAEAAFGIARTVPAVMWHLGVRHELLSYVFNSEVRPAYSAVALAMLAAPWVIGLRIDVRRPANLMPFAVVCAVLCFAPSFVLETSFVYERFALFLLPSYAWMFTTPPARKTGPAAYTASGGLIALCGLMLGLQGRDVWRFGQEATDFDRIAAHARPGQRAVAMVFDRASAAAREGRTYLHYASWYQVENEGLVDFNFAWVPPQIVRYRVASRPPFVMGLSWNPQNFDWLRHRGSDYQYFFVRGEPQDATTLFHDATCVPRLVRQEGRWRLFERGDCQP